MKQLTFITAMLLTSMVAHAQLNNLSNTELFDGIQFNNISLGRIMETKGDLTKIRSLFGNNMQEVSNNTGLFIGKELYNSNIVIRRIHVDGHCRNPGASPGQRRHSGPFDLPPNCAGKMHWKPQRC